MSQNFVIEGKHLLEGEVEVRGSKNAAGAVLSATLLTEDECRIKNIPLVLDILNLLDILKEMGVEIEWVEKRTVIIKAGEKVDPNKINFEKVSKSRVSVLLMGALLARFQAFKISRPGGDRIGVRPIDTHLRALKELGAEIETEGDFYYFNKKELKGKEIVLPEFSVTATENLIMASVLAEGTTLIKIAANDPQVQNLVEMLVKMGAEIKWLDSHTLKINGVRKLQGCEISVIPDFIETGTFAAIASVVGKKIRIKNIKPEHLDIFLLKLKEIGIDFQKGRDFLLISCKENSSFSPTKLQALPYPGFSTDLLPLLVPVLTQAKGKSLIHDPLYENRLNYTQELRKMGADIEIVDPHRAFVFGRTPLSGVTIESWDIRAGASLVIAGLMADGKTTIKSIEQIDRGYERLEERLRKLGAQIKRVNSF